MEKAAFWARRLSDTAKENKLDSYFLMFEKHSRPVFDVRNTSFKNQLMIGCGSPSTSHSKFNSSPILLTNISVLTFEMNVTGSTKKRKEEIAIQRLSIRPHFVYQIMRKFTHVLQRARIVSSIFYRLNKRKFLCAPFEF